jgi:methionyl-tRNA synthetase
VFIKIGELDAFIQTSQPFKTIKTDAKKAQADIVYLAQELYAVGEALAPFMPETSATIMSLVQSKKTPDKPLFERKV